jgi:hypothetical protein
VLSATSRLTFRFFFIVFSLSLLLGIAKEGKFGLGLGKGHLGTTHIHSSSELLGFRETSKKGIASVSGLGKRTAIRGCMEFI